MAAKKKKKHPKKTSYKPGVFAHSPVLTGVSHTVASRFSYGITPALAREVKAAGGGIAWFEKQLSTAYDGQQNVANWWPALLADPESSLVRDADPDDLAAHYPSWLLARRMTSPRPLLEKMTEFWENHLHVPSRPDAQVRYRADYGRMIRQRALGKFSDLLVAAEQHPAMQLYLGGSDSEAEHPNENLGRELLELHTVGVGNYTEDDVKNSARILTGFVIDQRADVPPTYVPTNHWIGPVVVMSKRVGWPAPFVSLNLSPDGRAVLADYLRYLARHPATAQRIAQKLAQTFVSDTPPAALVTQLAQVYLAHDTAIVPVLRTLIRSPAFTQSAGKKLRDPAADLVATHRVIGSRFSAPRDWDWAANEVYGQLDVIGAAPMTWPTPDGAPVVGAPWASPVRALVSADVHYSAAGGWFPYTGVHYPAPRSFLPRKQMAFRLWVDHLSRVVLGRPSDKTLLKACCTATGLKPTQKIKRTSSWAGMNFPDLLVVLLDHPAHYHH